MLHLPQLRGVDPGCLLSPHAAWRPRVGLYLRRLPHRGRPQGLQRGLPDLSRAACRARDHGGTSLHPVPPARGLAPCPLRPCQVRPAGQPPGRRVRFVPRRRCADRLRGAVPDLPLVPQGHAVGVAANCQTCHSPEAWKPARFQHARFALVGKHSAVPCASCHRDAVYAGKPADCASCHQTPAAHLPGLNSACERCHSPNGWRPANIDHSGFELTGAHQSAACVRCHSDGQYDGKSTACESCHSKPANHLATAATCSQCHATSGWRPARYTHAGFQLVGKHQSAACASCHTDGVYSARSSRLRLLSQPAGGAHTNRVDGLQPVPHAQRLEAGQLQPRQLCAGRPAHVRGLRQLPLRRGLCRHAQHLRLLSQPAGGAHPDWVDGLQPVPHAQRLEAGQL